MADPAVRKPLSRRDQRLDVFRGLALITIFITHSPPNVFEGLTIRNFGFSDAAEGFVLMSGISAGLAYSPGLRERGASAWQTTLRIWARARTLYFTHLLITVVALLIAATFAAVFAAPELLHKHGIDLMFEAPGQFLLAVPLLSHQLGYINILPLYIALLLVTPALIAAGVRRPAWLLAGSVALWALAGHWRVNIPDWPSEGGWFLNPFCWQLLFVVGLLTGIAMRAKTGPWGHLRWLRWVGLFGLVLALAWREWDWLGASGNHLLWLGHESGLSSLLTSFNKTHIAVPRLLHAFALFAVVAGFPVFKRLCEQRGAAPIALLGRQALPVFALSTLLGYTVQGVKTITPGGLVLDTLLIGAGVALLLGFAAAKEARATRTALRPVPADPEPVRAAG
ncbi:OpgC family protein [Tranquillimonas rosea]|uniref:OpgC family protein n=1 Tax=Tranquillimonas rosea TaxID=641238 RepID=UPI003BACF3DB